MLAYLKFYGLARSPFDNGESRRFVLATSPLKRLLSRVRADLANGETHLCVHGPPGIGKSAVLRALPKVLEGVARVACIPDPLRPWPELRAAIAAGLALPNRQIVGPALEQVRREQRLVVVIDQAERLSAEALDHLDVILQYADPATGRPYLQLVLLTDRDAAAQQPGMPLLSWFDWHPITHLELEPFDPRDVAVYIDKRMKRAGWRGGRLFSQSAAHAVAEVARGNPREVNVLCDRVLQLAFERCSPSIDPELVAEACGEAPVRRSPSAAHMPAAEAGPDRMLIAADASGLDASLDLRPTDFRQRRPGAAGTAEDRLSPLDDDTAPLQLLGEDEEEAASAVAPLRAMTDPEPVPIVRTVPARPVPAPRERPPVRAGLRRLLWISAVLAALVGVWTQRDTLPAPIVVLLDEVEGLWEWEAPYLAADADADPAVGPLQRVGSREDPAGVPRAGQRAWEQPPLDGAAAAARLREVESAAAVAERIARGPLASDARTGPGAPPSVDPSATVGPEAALDAAAPVLAAEAPPAPSRQALELTSPRSPAAVVPRGASEDALPAAPSRDAAPPRGPSGDGLRPLGGTLLGDESWEVLERQRRGALAPER